MTFTRVTSWVRVHSALLRTLMSGLLVVASVVWIGAVVRNADVSFASIDLNPSVWVLLSVVVFALASAATKGVVFSLLLKRRDPGIPAVRSTGVYLVSQLVRYLPGRVWGFIYAAVRLSDVAPQRFVWSASIENLLLSTLNSLGIGIAVTLTFLNRPGWGILGLGVVWLLLALELRQGLFSQPLSRMLRRVGIPPRERGWSWTSVFLLFQVDWVLYSAVWILALSKSYDVIEAALLGVLYALAWIVGLLAVIVPAGLVVREATFVWLATQFGFDSEAVLVLAGLARVFFLGVDFFAFGMGLVMARHRQTRGQVLNHVG